MERKEFKQDIRATREKVWDILWSSETYPKWTAAFMEGSHAETDWQEGGEVHFWGPDGNGTLSKILRNDTYHNMIFEHQGIIKNGKKDTESPEAKAWQGIREDYTITQTDDITTIFVQIDLPEKYEESMSKSFPKALEKVMELAEKK